MGLRSTESAADVLNIRNILPVREFPLRAERTH